MNQQTQTSQDTSQDILYEVRGGVGRVTFNRPQARNAFTFAMYEQLAAICDEANRDRAIKVLVLQGAGDRGVVVTGVDSSGIAAEHGFAQGDVIVSVNGKEVATPADVRTEIGKAREDGRKNVLMHVKSGDNLRFVTLPVGQG